MEKSGTLVFNHGEVEKIIEISIVPHDDEEDNRDQVFGFEISNVTPAGAKISKKNFKTIRIVLDDKMVNEQAALR